MPREKRSIDSIPTPLLLDEMRAFGAWDCVKPLEQQAKSCTHVSKNMSEWCPSCRAWALLAYFERKLPTKEYRTAVATHISNWKQAKKAAK